MYINPDLPTVSNADGKIKPNTGVATSDENAWTSFWVLDASTLVDTTANLKTGTLRGWNQEESPNGAG